MNFFCKVSKKDFSRFCTRVQSDFYRYPTYLIKTQRPDGVIVTSYCLDDVEIAQRVKSVDKRAEYYINPFFKEA